MKDDTLEWTDASEEDKQAWSDLSEEEQDKLRVEAEKREKEAKEKELEEQRKATEGVKVYEDSKVKINFLDVDYNGVVFLVENKTNKVLTIQADSVAINGYSTDNIVMSDDVSPQSKGKVIARCSPEEYDAKTLSGQLSVINFKTYDSYDVTFTNINVE